MKILLNPIGSHGDVHPFVGFGIELRRRGHDVTVVTNGHFEPLVRSAGLTFVELGSDGTYRTLMADPDLWHPRRAPAVVFGQGVFPALHRTVTVLRELIEPGQTVLVSGSLGLAARIVQELTGVPHATVHLAPLAFRSVIAPPKLPGIVMPRSHALRRLMFRLGDAMVIDRVITRPLNAQRRVYNLPPVTRFMDEWWHSPDAAIGTFPDWFCPPQPDWPPQAILTGFPLYDEREVTPISPSLERFLQTGAPPIAFTPGSAMLHGHGFFSAAVGACVQLKRHGVLLTRHREQVPANLPASVVHVDYAPFSALLPRCAALVHHGGIWTTAQGLAAGLPQVVMPMAHDQHDNAARLVHLGVGATVAPRRFTARNLATALSALLDDAGTITKANALADKMRGVDAIAKTADVIEGLLARAAQAGPTTIARDT